MRKLKSWLSAANTSICDGATFFSPKNVEVLILNESAVFMFAWLDKPTGVPEEQKMRRDKGNKKRHLEDAPAIMLRCVS